MKAPVTLLVTLLVTWLVAAPAWAQVEAPPLDYVVAPDHFSLPAGMTVGNTTAVAINSKGHIFILNRGPTPLMEFDADGKFIRSLLQGYFDRPHGVRVDPQDNIWATDTVIHVVYKISPEGRIVQVHGVRNTAGERHHYGHLPLLNEPTDIAFGPTGDVFISQSHGRGDQRVLKLDKNGNFVKTWGKKGKGPGEFNLPHSIVADAKGLLYVADRDNERIQVFDPDGNFIRAMHLAGTPTGLFITPDQQLWVAHGYTGQILKLDLGGKVLGSFGAQGKGPGQFGEAHFLAVSARNEIFVADPLNWSVQKFVRKKP